LAAQRLSLVLDLEDPTWEAWAAAGAKEMRELIRSMSRDNPMWGAPKIHGELLKLGIERMGLDSWMTVV
jgi:hypothetical protein